MIFVDIVDTYCEAFEGLCVQLQVTAQDAEFLNRAVHSFTALPSTVFGDAEGGIVRWLSENETIDGRLGAIVQLWVTGTGKKSTAKFYDQLGRRMRQGILVVPTTAVFDHYPQSAGEKFNMMNNVGHCGDGYEWIDEYEIDSEMIHLREDNQIETSWYIADVLKDMLFDRFELHEIYITYEYPTYGRTLIAKTNLAELNFQAEE